MSLSQNRRAFTLVELLVVIAIIGVLVALLLPAVQAAREAARRSSCSNNLKQIGIGLHNYHDTKLAFPMGQNNWIGQNASSKWQRSCWFQLHLPFVEQQPLFDQLDAYTKQTPAPGHVIAFPINNTIVKMFVCPSDGEGPKNETTANSKQGFHGNYVLCAGSTVFNPTTPVADPNGINLNGMFFPFSTTKFASNLDGTSNTIYGGEILTVKDTTAHDLRGRYWNTWQGNVLMSTLYPPNTTVGDVSSYCITAPRRPCQGLNTANVVQSARSNHPGGGMFLMGDASVRFIPSTVDLLTYQALGTRQQGETLGNF